MAIAPMGSQRDALASRIWASWFTVLIAVVIGLAIGVTGLVASSAGARAISWLGIASLAVAAIWISVLRPQWPTVLLIVLGWVGIGTPGLTEGGSGDVKGLYIGEGLALLSIIGMIGPIWHLRKRLAIPRGIWIPMTIFMVISVWSVGHNALFPDLNVAQYSTVKSQPLVNVLELALRLMAILALPIGVALVRKGHRDLLLNALLAGGLISLVVSLSPLSGYAPAFAVFGRAVAVGLAVYAAAAGTFSTAMRIISGCFALTCLVVSGVVGAEWVSGLVAVTISGMLVLYQTKRNVFWWMIAAVSLLVLLRADSVVDRIYRPNFYAGGQMEWGTRTLGDRDPGMFENDRTRMLMAAVRYAEAFPLGVGPGNYRRVNQYYGRRDVWNTTQFTSAHGTVAQTLSETGWAGLLSLLAMIGAILQQLWARSRKDPVVTGLAAGCTAIALASLLGDYLFPTYHNGGLAHFGATVVFWLAAGVGLGNTEDTQAERST
jgi:hypothetical protein